MFRAQCLRTLSAETDKPAAVGMFTRKAPMIFRPSRMKSATLTDREKAALRGIAVGGTVELQMCKRLQELGLIQQKQSGWELSEQGYIKLMFQDAR